MSAVHYLLCNSCHSLLILNVKCLFQCPIEETLTNFHVTYFILLEFTLYQCSEGNILAVCCLLVIQTLAGFFHGKSAQKDYKMEKTHVADWE